MAVIPPTLLGTPTQGRTGFTTFPVLTLAHTVPAGTEALLVAATTPAFIQPLTTVTWMGTPVPIWLYRGSGVVPQFFVLLKPTPGTGDLVITSNVGDLTNVAATVVNIKDFAAIRVMEWNGQAFPFTDIDVDVYSDSSDLLLSFAWWIEPGLVVTPMAGQTVVASMSGEGGGNVAKTACSVRTAPLAKPATTTVGWNVTTTVGWFSNYAIAIKGIDPDTPAGLPSSIGCVTDFLSLDAQPPPTIALADINNQGRHYIDPNYRRLVVITGNGNAGTIGVLTFTPDGGAPIALTLVQGVDLGSHTGAVWMLDEAPVGYGYLRYVPADFPQVFGWGAYSLSADGLIATAINGTDLLTVPSSVGAIVVDYMNFGTSSPIAYTPASGQTPIFVQQIVGSDNQPEPDSFVSYAGPSGFRIASGLTTPMEWASSPAIFGQSHGGFSFIGIIPPPPPIERPGCPQSLGLLPAEGDGCSNQVAPQAV